MTQTLDKYDFESVHKYIESLNKHILEKTKGEITITNLILDTSDEDESQFACLSTHGNKLPDMLIYALLKVLPDKKKKREKGSKKSLDELMEMLDKCTR